MTHISDPDFASVVLAFTVGPAVLMGIMLLIWGLCHSMEDYDDRR